MEVFRRVAPPRLVLALMPFVLSGCLGTMNTRYKNVAGEFGPIGDPPFQAVIGDMQNVFGAGPVCDPIPEWYTRLFAFVSIPIDLIVDVVLFPIDLGAAGLGFEKRPFHLK